MQLCWIGLQIEAKNAGAVVLRRGFSTRICKLRRRNCALRILETHPSSLAAFIYFVIVWTYNCEFLLTVLSSLSQFGVLRWQSLKSNTFLGERIKESKKDNEKQQIFKDTLTHSARYNHADRCKRTRRMQRFQ
jgi:hypothetical protein